MSHRVPLAVLVVLLAGCQATPAPFSPSGTRLGHQRVAVEELELQIELLAAMVGQDALVHRGSSPTGEWVELNARLGQLTERLDHLIARLPETSREAGAVVEAAARNRPVDYLESDSEATCIAALTAAVAAADQTVKLGIENITNVNTIGYKRQSMATTSFRDEAAGMTIPRAGAVRRIWTTGTLEITDRSLDVAIAGVGFFEVRLADGSTGYTRNGSFHVNADGKLVTGAGNVLIPEIHLPQDLLEISISPTGTVSGRTAGNPDVATEFGRVALNRFINPSGLRELGDGVFRPAEESGMPILGQPGLRGLGTIKQGFLERSNVQVLNENVNLQLARRQRAMLVRQLADFGVFVR